MVRGDGKPEGNGRIQLPSGFPSPLTVHAGPLDITVPDERLASAHLRPCLRRHVSTGSSIRPAGWGACGQLSPPLPAGSPPHRTSAAESNTSCLDGYRLRIRMSPNSLHLTSVVPSIMRATSYFTVFCA